MAYIVPYTFTCFSKSISTIYEYTTDYDKEPLLYISGNHLASAITQSIIERKMFSVHSGIRSTEAE